MSAAHIVQAVVLSGVGVVALVVAVAMLAEVFPSGGGSR